jgi:hypothetical protein
MRFKIYASRLLRLVNGEVRGEEQARSLRRGGLVLKHQRGDQADLSNTDFKVKKQVKQSQ